MIHSTTARSFVIVCLVAMLAGTGPASVRAGVASASAAQNPEERYNAAEERLAAGDAAGAVRLFEALVADFPATPAASPWWRTAARVRAGEIELSLGLVQPAAARFVEVTESEGPSAWTYRARLGLATTLLWDGEWAAAATLLQELIDAAHDPESEVDELTRRSAAERLTLLHRVWLRPAAGEAPWQRSGRFVVGRPLQRPIGVAAGADGVLVTDESLDAVVFIDLQGNAGTFTVVDPQRPWWGAGGDGYVAAAAAVNAPLRVEAFQFAVPDGNRQRPLQDVRAGVRTASGEWFLIDGRYRDVLQFGADGAFVRGVSIGADREPVDLAQGLRGDLFVVEKRRREVAMLDASGNLRGAFALDGWREPYAVATDALGMVYVLDRGLKRIDVFDSAGGGVLWTLGPTLPGGVVLDDPRDIAVDGNGRILVADRGLAVVVVIE